MQALAFVCSILFVIIDLAQPQNQDDNGSRLYTRRYEHLDIDTILASPRLVTNYVECLLNKKPCPPEGKALKRILPEALKTKCSRCWPSQKEGALKVITSLYYKYPNYYQALRERWDPTGEYHRRFEEYLRDQKFNSIGSNADNEPGEQQAQGSSVSINITQRPTRQDELTTQNASLPEISNRFGVDDSSIGYEYENPTSTSLPSIQRPQRPQMPQQSVVQPQRPQQVPLNSMPPRTPSSSSSSGSSSQPVASASNQPGSNTVSATSSPTWTTQNTLPGPGIPTTTYYLKTKNPVLNIINRITMKFANTAEFIAGMLRGAVPQPQQQAVRYRTRTHCDKLKRSLFSCHNTRINHRTRRY